MTKGTGFWGACGIKPISSWYGTLVLRPLLFYSKEIILRTCKENFIKYVYDEDRDAFIPPTPYTSWILNEETCQWQAPVAKPELTQEQIDNNNYYVWNETTKQWDLNE